MSAEGPIDEQPWPEKLPVHVVEPGPRPRVHGYDVQGDLARHYGLADLLFLSLTGELPPEDARRALDVCLLYLAPVGGHEAPVHAAALARRCEVPLGASLGLGAVVLAEQARSELEIHGELLRMLAGEGGPLPERSRSVSEEDRAAVGRLREALQGVPLSVPALEQDPGLLAAILCVLSACGLRSRDQLHATMLAARLPCLAGELLATVPGTMGEYPIDLPHFEYSDDG